MSKDSITRMHAQFDSLAQAVPDEGIEFWFARDLQEPLGYVRWENFMTAIQRAIESCETTGFAVDDHFRGVTKMVSLGSGAERSIDDFMLTRYACYSILLGKGCHPIPSDWARSLLTTLDVLGGMETDDTACDKSTCPR